jgi:hypothetical protein
VLTIHVLGQSIQSFALTLIIGPPLVDDWTRYRVSKRNDNIGCVIRLNMIRLETTTLERVGVAPIVENQNGGNSAQLF